MSCDIGELCGEITHLAPDHFCIQNRQFPSLSGVSGTQLDHNFLRSNQTEAA